MKENGQRCRFHKGLPEAPPRQPKPRRSARSKSSSGTVKSSSNRGSHVRQRRGAGPERRPTARQYTRGSAGNQEPTARRSRQGRTKAEQERRDKRVEAARDFCVDILTDGWQDAVATKVSDYVGEKTFQRLAKRHENSCRSLAAFAGRLLQGKERLHDFVGSVARWIAALLTGNRMIQAVARKLARKIPLPWDHQVITVARGMQIIGILLCVRDGRNLAHCQCFVDLAIDETKERVKRILAGALDDWPDLEVFPAQRSSGEPAADSAVR